MDKRLNVLLLVCIVSVLCVGCVTGGTKEGGTQDESLPVLKEGLLPSDSPRFDDVPVPEGFRINSDRSFVYEDSEIQIGFIEYTGRKELSDVVDFYREEMKNLGWQWLRDLEFGGIEMIYSKEDRRCFIRIRSKLGQTTISVILIPKEGAAAD